MSKNYLTEAFKELDLLESQSFDVDKKGTSELEDFLEDDSLDDFEVVIDPEAETEEDLQKSYMGKVILMCDVCRSMIYKDPAEIVIDEESQLANVGELCPYCFTGDGYKIVGKVAPYEEVTVEAEKPVKVKVDGEEVEVEDKIEEEIQPDQKFPVEHEKAPVMEGMASSVALSKSISKVLKSRKHSLNKEEFNKLLDELVDSYASEGWSFSEDGPIDLEDVIAMINAADNGELRDLGEKWLGLDEDEDDNEEDYSFLHPQFKSKLGESIYKLSEEAKILAGDMNVINKVPENEDKVIDYIKNYNLKNKYESFKQKLNNILNYKSKADSFDNPLKESMEDIKELSDNLYYKLMDISTILYYASKLDREDQIIDFMNKKDLKSPYDYIEKNIYKLLDYKLKNEAVAIKESMDDISITTEDQVIKIKSTPREDKETIQPVTETEVEEAKEAEEDIPTEEVKTQEEEIVEEPEEIDVDLDEIDEEGMDDLGESYLKSVYENVNSFKTSKAILQGNKMILEGVISFTSGNKAKTKFIFESKEATKRGKLKFLGENKNISKNKKAFTLIGSLNNKKLMLESLNYNYTGKDSKTGKTKRLYGTIRRKLK